MSRSPEPADPRRPATLLSLPPELHLLIALHLYSPLHLTQQDRLTWSVFSTVDMDPERWHGMDGLIAFAGTCKAVRRTVRYLLFRCVRVHGLREGRWLIRASTRSGCSRGEGIRKGAGKTPAATGDDWGKYVHSVILDMAMFDPDQQQVQLDEEGRGGGARGDYDDDDESHRAIQTRVARWTTLVQTDLSTPSGGVSPFTIHDTVQALDERISVERVSENSIQTFSTALDSAPDLKIRKQDEQSPKGIAHTTHQGEPDDSATTDIRESSVVRAVDTPSRGDINLLDDGSPEGEYDEDEEEEEWESFPLTPPRVRDPWKEASFLITMLTRLPSLHHLSIFADPSDDLTLSLLFSHPAMLAIAPRLRSFGWRLRASPPSALRDFDNSTMYVSIQGWLKECTMLGFLVLDSDIEKEGVREVDLERVVTCLGEGRERTLRRRAREARKERRLEGRGQDDSGRIGRVDHRVKRKHEVSDEDVPEMVKRQRVNNTTASTFDRQQTVGHLEDVQPTNQIRRHTSHLAPESPDLNIKPSNLSLMLCGPIQGWMLSAEAEVWAAENMDDLRTWMTKTRAKLSLAPNGTHESNRGKTAPDRGLSSHLIYRRDELTPAPEPSSSSIFLPTAAGTFLDPFHSPSAPSPLLSPVSVLSSSYSPVALLSGANGGTAYFHHQHHHFGQHGQEAIQPYIHHIPNAPYQPHYAGIVPSYTNNTHASSPSATVYPARPPLRTHSRSRTSATAAERRKTALENRPPVFLDGIVRLFTGIKELFIDRPIRAPYGSEDDTLRLLSIALIPLMHLPELTLLQIGGYPLSGHYQLVATDMVVNLCPKILLCGWLGLEGETNWYGVWRDRTKKVQVEDYWGRGALNMFAYRLKLLGDGDLFDLEEEQQAVML